MADWITEIRNWLTLKNVVAGVLGAVTVHLWKRYFSRRTVVRWSVDLTTLPREAAVDRVEVTYRGKQHPHVYWQHVEVENLSGSNDLTDVTIRARALGSSIFIGDRVLTAGQNFPWTTDFAEVVQRVFAAWSKGEPADEADNLLFHTRRDFVIPVLNRGEIVRFVFLATTADGSTPHPTLTCIHPGVVTRQDKRKALFWGVSQLRALTVGLVAGTAASVGLSSVLSGAWLAVSSFVLGCAVLGIGASLMIGVKKIRQIMG